MTFKLRHAEQIIGAKAVTAIFYQMRIGVYTNCVAASLISVVN